MCRCVCLTRGRPHVGAVLRPHGAFRVLPTKPLTQRTREARTYGRAGGLGRQLTGFWGALGARRVPRPTRHQCQSLRPPGLGSTWGPLPNPSLRHARVPPPAPFLPTTATARDPSPALRHSRSHNTLPHFRPPPCTAAPPPPLYLGQLVLQVRHLVHGLLQLAVQLRLGGLLRLQQRLQLADALAQLLLRVGVASPGLCVVRGWGGGETTTRWCPTNTHARTASSSSCTGPFAGARGTAGSRVQPGPPLCCTARTVRTALHACRWRRGGARPPAPLGAHPGFRCFGREASCSCAGGCCCSCSRGCRPTRVRLWRLARLAAFGGAPCGRCRRGRGRAGAGLATAIAVVVIVLVVIGWGRRRLGLGLCRCRSRCPRGRRRRGLGLG